MVEDCSKWRCNNCDNLGLSLGDDGFYYCNRCGSQSQEIIETGVADEDFMEKDGHGAIYTASLRRTVRQTQTQSQPLLTQAQSQFWSQFTQDQTPVAEPDTNNEDTNFAFTDSYFITPITKEEDGGGGGGYVDGVGPTEPEDFGAGGGEGLGYEEYYSEVRMRYVMGLQLMVESQCEALVEKFNVHPSICGIVGPIWMRFLAHTGVFSDHWADQTVQESELLIPGDPKDIAPPPAKYRAEPHNIHGQRAVTIWFRALRKRIPLPCSLAISFLACHIAREAVLPTDLIKWSVEGKLPYLAAYIEIEKQFGQASKACPIPASVMFRPSYTLLVQKLESFAASIANSIGLYLPPVNFYSIASRYLKQLSLPVKKILPLACRIHEWTMPPDLWLSTSELRLPTRVCVMSIIIVAIRILCDINGFGIWESSFSNQHEGSLDHPSNLMNDIEECSDFSTYSMDNLGAKVNSSDDRRSDLDAAELLRTLEEKYSEIRDTSEYSEDLPRYLQYCKDVAFAGLKPPFEDYEEERLIEQFWNFYQNEKQCQDSESLENLEEQTKLAFDGKRLRNDGSPSTQRKRACSDPRVSGLSPDNRDSSPSQPNDKTPPEDNLKLAKAIERLKSDMAENRFSYIPPRVVVKRKEYLHHERKRDEGSMLYVAHADYYILLRSCARMAQVDIRIMHLGSLSFERRLAWTERRINHCLHLTPPTKTCEFCSEVPDDDDPIGLSNLSV